MLMQPDFVRPDTYFKEKVNTSPKWTVRVKAENTWQSIQNIDSE